MNGLDENELARISVDVAFHIHQRLGPGLYEHVYEKIMEHELTKRGLRVQRQVPFRLVYDDLQFEEAFRADLVVGDKLIIELKSVERTVPEHRKQLVTYLKVADYRLGLLINFGADRIKDGIARVANEMRDC